MNALNPLTEYVPSNYTNGELMNCLRDVVPPHLRVRLEEWADAAEIVDAAEYTTAEEAQELNDRVDRAEGRLELALQRISDIREAMDAYLDKGEGDDSKLKALNDAVSKAELVEA